MPEQAYDSPTADKVLEFLEDYALTSYQSRCSNYQTIQGILEKESQVDNESIKRLLAVCVHDLNEDMKYAVNTLNVITVILKKVKSGECQCLPELTTSALSILNIIKTTALISKVQTLQMLCFETFLSFPDETHQELGSAHSSEVMEVFNLYFHQGIPMGIRLTPFNILFKMLKTLPPDKRLSFVKEGLNIWFSKVIPTTMAVVVTNNSMVPKILEVLELLTEELALIEYTSNIQWQTVLEAIYTPQKYPAAMKTLLENGNENWCRLWNVFVKLLKHQITLNKNKHGSPINSMLPVVEMAFKMDFTNRCRAFQCWNVLIDNFSTETNDNFVIKRIKLLIIPLKSNNAKVEEAALAKFNTWWHLIRKFEHRLDKLFDIVFIPFLHFCFGNPKHGEDKNILVPGLAFAQTTKKCVQAFVDITGHSNCDGCIPKKLPKLADKILSPKVFLDFLTDWIYCLKVFTKLLSSEKCVYEKKERYLRCVWGSLLSTVSVMPDDQRHVAYGELLALMTQISQECQEDKSILETVSNILTTYMTENKRVWTTLMKDNEDPQTSQLHKTLRLLLSPHLQKTFTGPDPSTSVKKLRPLTDLLINDSKTHNKLIDWILIELTPSDNTVILWTALMESVAGAKSDISSLNIKNMILWPLRHLDCVENAHHSASVWNNSYDKMRQKINDNNVEKEISTLLLTCKDGSTNQFALFALLQIIKDLLASDNSTEWKIEAELLVSILSKVKNHQEIESAFSVIIDSLMMMMKIVGEDKNTSLAEYVLTAVNTTLKLLLESARSSGPNIEHSNNVKKLLAPLHEELKTDLCIKFKFLLVEQLIACATVFDNYQAIKDMVCSILKTVLKKSKATEVPFYSVVNEAIISIEKPEAKAESKKTFMSPKVVKKTKKKEASSVNTVVENGEEYVVVKSNWKFNPRKLTENQKEKFQRKREDIPALYQDLSQSQDEIKLTAWKTDSQDTSTTNSTSKSNSKTSDSATVLKNMASTDVVPQIMENIFSENKTDVSNKTDKVTNENNKLKAKKPTAVTPKQVKSPRIALKDRVFQNAKNLIEKSSLKDGKAPKDLNKTISDPGPKTPVAKAVNEITATYSAPPKISSDRPARVKRKPRKYGLDFVEMNKKKRRNSTDTDDNRVEKSSFESHDEDIRDVSEDPKVKDTDKPKEINDVPGVLETVVDSDVAALKGSKAESKTIEDNKLEEMETEIVEQPLPETNEIIEITETNKPLDETNAAEKEDVSTPIALNKTVEQEKSKTSSKKPKKSRIVKELAIDMVEGHLFLNGEEKRSTRNTTPVNSRRKALSEKLNKSAAKTEAKTSKKQKTSEGKPENKEVFVKELSTVVKETQDNFSTSSCISDDVPMSEDFIESSQDSTLTTISVKSTKSVTKKSPKVLIEKFNGEGFLKNKRSMETQSLLSEQIDEPMDETTEAKDIEFSRNKPASDVTILTPDFDTEPVDNDKPISSSDDVIIIHDEQDPIEINTESANVHSDTIDIANADTEPINAKSTLRLESIEIVTKETQNETLDNKQSDTADDMTVTFQSTLPNSEELNDTGLDNGLSSPFKDEEQRNQDFLNNTLEISPIKTMSPVPDEKKSPERNDFVVIKLSSPVHSNGEPFEKSCSPEVFTEDKVSPDKRDQSPPREEISVNSNNSPSSSLSLKKRPQVRAAGRAAHMLGLCVPDHSIMSSERSDVDEAKKTPITPARRNLRILYNCENNEGDESEEGVQSFLKFKRMMPTSECSPSGPILKRKLADIADEATISPVSKRKRVSFHDPPVSTTISVQKYIEPLGVRSPQAAGHKRASRQHAQMKSPKKLETIFKLETALTKTLESFVDLTYNSEDMSSSSLEPTLSAEVVKNDELNDTDPICSSLINCSDPITNIATELSSPAMRDLLVKELEGKIETIGDLAKLTELEVNRLCIKAPKVKTAKKALSDYAEKMLVESQDFGTIEQTVEAQIHVDSENEKVETKESRDMDMQTEEVSVLDVEVQTSLRVTSRAAQTEPAAGPRRAVQTDPIDTWEEVKTFISKNPKDIGTMLAGELKNDSKEEIAQSLDVATLARVVTKNNLTVSDTNILLKSVLEKNTQSGTALKPIILKEYIAKNLSDKEILLLCSDLLRTVHDKPA